MTTYLKFYNRERIPIPHVYDCRGVQVRGSRQMIVVPEYRGYRIEVNAVAATEVGRWNAEVHLKLTAEHAEHAGEIEARRWIDLHRAPEQ